MEDLGKISVPLGMVSQAISFQGMTLLQPTVHEKWALGLANKKLKWS